MLMRLEIGAFALTLALAAACTGAAAQTTDSKPAVPAAAKKPAAPSTTKKPTPVAKPASAAKPATRPAARKGPVRKTAGGKPVPPPVVVVLPEASADQMAAAENIYYGAFECEFKQSIDIAKNAKFPGYVDVKYGKMEWTSVPVLSSTGALRLEDVKGESLVVQISSKSMLMNVKTGQRMVDDCVSPRQRELIEAARAAKAEAAASAASSGASEPEAASGLLKK
ncbi:MAG: hypothetical protein JWQ11_1030 [Rhizobacter sp.]|nr:hypothetical protein [Rhizobacter sp.]